MHYRRSPLVQGGLEVPCELTIAMIGSVVNHLLLFRYESLFKELYVEPEDEEIVGTFLSLAQHANEIGEIAETEPRPRQPKPNRQKKKEVNSRDIRDMFRIPTKKATNDKKVIVLD